MDVSIERLSQTNPTIMKLPVLFAAFAITTVAPLFAVTEADIAPAELVGKTVLFEIVNGGAPYAATGSFSATFETLGNGLALEDLTGDTEATTLTDTTYTASAADGTTEVRIPDFIAGQNDATLTLYVVDGEGRFEVTSTGSSDVSLNGTFNFSVMEVRGNVGPEIDVKQAKTVLKDGKSKVDFSTVLVTKKGKSRTKTFVIINSGNQPLKNLGYSVTGKNRKEFKVLSPRIGVLAPGGRVKIRVTFTPTEIGQRKAKLHILSNDEDESSFDVRLRGNGGGIK